MNISSTNTIISFTPSGKRGEIYSDTTKRQRLEEKEDQVQQIGIDILLGSDLIGEIASFLPIQDLFSLEICSKSCKGSLDRVWKDFGQTHVKEQLQWSACERVKNTDKWNSVLTVVTMDIVDKFFKYFCKWNNQYDEKKRLEHLERCEVSKYFEKFSFLNKKFPALSSFIEVMAYKKTYKVKNINKTETKSGDITFNLIFILANLNLKNTEKNFRQFYDYTNKAIEIESTYIIESIASYDNLKTARKNKEDKFKEFQEAIVLKACEKGNPHALINWLSIPGAGFYSHNLEEFIQTYPDMWPFQYRLAYYQCTLDIVKSITILKNMFMQYEEQIFKNKKHNLMQTMPLFVETHTKIVKNLKKNLRNYPQIDQERQIKDCIEIAKILLNVCSKDRETYSSHFDALTADFNTLVSLQDTN